MAGEVPSSAKQTSGRKRWKIYCRPRNPLKRYVNGILEDDSPDSQVFSAKVLLEEKCEDAVEREENSRLGVYWLIKASEQGHEEATRILQKCLDSGQGINEHNISDVKACLDMSIEEKVSRHAARELFASLSQGEDYITSEQLAEEMLKTEVTPGSSGDVQRRQQKIGNGVEGAAGMIEKQTVENDWKSRLTSCSHSEKLTEDMLVSAASDYSKGELPLVHRVLVLDQSPRQAPQLNFVSFLRSPFVRLRHSATGVIHSIAGSPTPPIWISTTTLQTLLILAYYSLFGWQGVLDATPSLVYYLSIVAMLTATCQIVAKRWEGSHFRRWSNLLVSWGGPGVNPDDAQWAHTLNNIKPIFLFLFAVFVNLLLTPFVPVLSIPHSELAVLSTLCSIILLYHFMWYKGKLDFLVLLSFGIHMLAKYPYDLDNVVSQDWRFLDVHVPTFASYVVGTGVEFCLNFKAIFYMLLPSILIKIAARDKWRGIYTVLLPHCVSLAWWQMAIFASNGATWYGLIRTCLALLGVIVFLPLAGLASVLLPTMAFAKYLMSTELLPLPATVALSCLGFLFVWYLTKIQQPDTTKLTTWFQVVLCILSAGILVYPFFTSPQGLLNTPDVPANALSWRDYQNYCIPNRKDVSLPIQDEIRCSSLAGLQISWEGKVVSTNLNKVFNPLSMVLSKFPSVLVDHLACLYGEKFEDCIHKEDCLIPPGLRSKCHFSNWNRYEYKITVAMNTVGMWSGNELESHLIGDSAFKNFSLGLIKGDRIWFTGLLIGNEQGILDGKLPRIRLLQAGCLSCTGDPTPPTTHASSSQFPTFSFNDACIALKTILNFLFNPIISFK